MNKLVIKIFVIVLLVLGVVSASSVTGRVIWNNLFKEKSLSPEKIVERMTDGFDNERFNILGLDKNINEKEQKMIYTFKKAEAKR